MEEVNGGGMFLKVMTDEQIEVLRKQIAVYATICEQLVELHKSLTSQNDLAGVRMGNLYCDSLLASGGHKMTGRQRWTPTPVQLQILERTFDQENGTPSKQKIKEMASDLSQHGQISETNVYNWFQNRRARSKRKQHATPANNGESELETEAESSDEKKTKPDDPQSQRVVNSEDVCVPNTLFSSEIVSVDPLSSVIPETSFPVEASLSLGGSFEPFYGTMLQDPRMDHELMGSINDPNNYNPFMQQEDYGLSD